MTVTAAARPLDRLFEEYGESHRNRINKTIHFIAVPLIYLSIMGLLWAIPVPAFMAGLPGVNWATLAFLPALAYYLRLSTIMAVCMIVLTALCFQVLRTVEAAGLSVLWFSVVLFVVMWILQFVGHHIEGKKPSFFKDLQFLLIGPAWILGFLLRKAGIPY
ncbi:MAG: DUF962 domain-containing protein [Pseudomonadota bacterium]